MDFIRTDLIEDTSDFILTGAKAAHTVLCCYLERGTATWNDTTRKMYFVMRMQQKQVNILKPGSSRESLGRKPCFSE